MIERRIKGEDRFVHNAYQTLERIRFVERFSPLIRDERDFDVQRSVGAVLHLSASPRNALGAGLITKEEVATVGGDSLSQSNLSFGLIIPVSLFLYAIAFRSGFRPVALFSFAAIALLSSMILTVVGIECARTYRLDFQALILGRFEKRQVARMQKNQREQ